MTKELLPVDPDALEKSIKEVDELTNFYCDEPLTQSQGESIALILHELKRLRAACDRPSLAPAGLIELLQALRPKHGAVGTRDVDVTEQQRKIDAAIAMLSSSDAWSYDISPPQGFIDYVKKNYSGEVVFHDPEWHALRLWNAAMKNAKPPVVSFDRSSHVGLTPEQYHAACIAEGATKGNDDAKAD
jgi:hypothetical protein